MTINQALLGQAIKKIRKIRGLTQAQLARSAGLAEGGNSVALIERGQRGVSMESLNALADGLEVPAACLTILATPTPSHDRELKKMLVTAQQLVDRVVRLHTILSKEEAAKGKSKRAKRRKNVAARSKAVTPRKRDTAA